MCTEVVPEQQGKSLCSIIDKFNIYLFFACGRQEV